MKASQLSHLTSDLSRQMEYALASLLHGITIVGYVAQYVPHETPLRHKHLLHISRNVNNEREKGVGGGSCSLLCIANDPMAFCQRTSVAGLHLQRTPQEATSAHMASQLFCELRVS